MRWAVFAGRTGKEILRDPLTLAFGLGFPLVLMVLLSAIQANVPVSLFEIDSLAPGLSVFGLAFMTLFSAQLLAKDRESALLQRLYATPLSAADYICGYVLPMLPISLAQGAVCYLAAMVLGLPLTGNLLVALLMLIPVSLFFVGLGLLCGSILSVKQVGSVCGALLTNLTAWLSGIWFDLDLVGEGFKKAAYLLPFVHGVELERAAVAGNAGEMGAHLGWVCGYAAVMLAGAVWAFLRQMKRQ